LSLHHANDTRIYHRITGQDGSYLAELLLDKAMKSTAWCIADALPTATFVIWLPMPNC